MAGPDSPLRILVADAQVAFTAGGAPLMVRGLIDHLRQRGHQADLIQLPLRPEKKDTLLQQAAAWRMLDLETAAGLPVDLLITTRFPSYFARHPNKVAWVTHQHRAAYELCDTPYSDFGHADLDVAVRRQLLDLDRQMLGECRRVFTIARTTAARLANYNGVTALPLYQPPPLAPLLREGPFGNEVLIVGRLEPTKRVELALAAMAHVPAPLRLVVIGVGSERARLEALSATLGVGSRVRFEGALDDDALAARYASALAVLYIPYDEDYGFVTLEGFLAGKPVVTAADSGGTLEFVTDGVSGVVAQPEPASLGRALATVHHDRALAARLGQEGRRRALAISWDAVVDQLLG